MQARSRAEREWKLSVIRRFRALRGVLLVFGVLLASSLALLLFVQASARPPVKLAELAQVVGPISPDETYDKLSARVWEVLVGPSASWFAAIVALTLAMVVVGACWVVARAWSWRGQGKFWAMRAVIPGLIVAAPVAFVTYFAASEPMTWAITSEVDDAVDLLHARGRLSFPSYLRSEFRAGLDPLVGRMSAATLFGGGVIASSLGAFTTAWPASIMWRRHRRARER